MAAGPSPSPSFESSVETATLAAGCFWCVEALFKKLKGVISVRSGYTGGTAENPTYQEVSAGHTHHAEAVQMRFDPRRISFAQILDVFWQIHDPTSLNRQDADVGSQYRSAIFYHDDNQRQTARLSREKLARSGQYQETIVTEIVPLAKFYPAESYHQDYYDKNPTAPYCRLVIAPKIQKLMKKLVV